MSGSISYSFQLLSLYLMPLACCMQYLFLEICYFSLLRSKLIVYSADIALIMPHRGILFIMCDFSSSQQRDLVNSEWYYNRDNVDQSDYQTLILLPFCSVLNSINWLTTINLERLKFSKKKTRTTAAWDSASLHLHPLFVMHIITMNSVVGPANARNEEAFDIIWMIFFCNTFNKGAKQKNKHSTLHTLQSSSVWGFCDNGSGLTW